MSYIVPKDKPNRCTDCPFMDRITYDCKLMYGDDYPDFESQYEHCPLVEVNKTLFSADNARKFFEGESVKGRERGVKYIVEIAKEYEEYFKGILICGIVDGKFAVDVSAREDLEELNSDYINEHFGDLQDTAYDKGYAQCQDDYGDALKHAKDTAYQRGLNDAWEAARKIVCDEGIDMDTLCTIFRRGCSDSIIRDYSASEAIAKLKAYEEKQKADDRIEVGDEVEWDNDFTGDRFIVTRIYQPYGKKEQCDGIDDDGDVYRAVLIESLVKTGRHFDIAKILEDMKA